MSKGSLEKRIENIETAQKQHGGIWHVLVLRDNCRAPFRASDITRRHVQIIPTEKSKWPDGTRVFDKFTPSQPVDDCGRLRRLSADDWERLREIESMHQGKG